MLIFGLSNKEALLATLLYVCENCGNQAAHHLIRYARRFTLFFIPVIPLGTRYVDVCTFCGRSVEVTKEQAEQALASR